MPSLGTLRAMLTVPFTTFNIAPSGLSCAIPNGIVVEIVTKPAGPPVRGLLGKFTTYGLPQGFVVTALSRYLIAPKALGAN